MDQLTDIRDDTAEKMRAKIVFILSVYPKLNYTMLQVGLGPHIKARIWRPVLNQMVEEGIVLEEERQLYTHLDQWRTYGILSLAPGREMPFGKEGPQGVLVEGNISVPVSA